MDADLNKISGMKIDELKYFLRLRGLKVSGKKAELVARVFVAVENDVPLVKSAEEVEREIANEYRSKLVIEGYEIPDPFGLKQDWLDEENGVKFWPVTMYPDIFNFLAFHPNELASSDLSDYKTSKAYSYYSQGWLSKLQFHNICGDSKYCLLKGTCRPSQRINDALHKFWICLLKKTGKIICTHCTCMAGLSQTCNHIAAALFRVEAASRMGLNNPSCTSTACQWLPNNKNVGYMKVKDMKLKRSDFGQRGKKKTELNCSPKKNHNPIASFSYSLSLESMAASLGAVCNESDNMLFTALPKERPAKKDGKPEETLYSLEDFFSISESKDDFAQSMKKFTKGNCKSIEVLTCGQSTNPKWFYFRKHVITASKAHDVKTKLASLKRTGSIGIHLDGIFNAISGDASINPEIPALKYGRSMESDAVNCFMEIFKKTHKNARAAECGLFLSEDMPYVGGSPDRIITCDCCGSSCLEVKCPFSIRHTTPTDPEVNLPFLKRTDGIVSLNINHKYFTQCQVQMAVTGLPSCYFFVWTAHGSYIQKIEFDNAIWQQLMQNFQDFYFNHYIPHLYKS